MIFKDYLEMMTRSEMRQAAQNGQTNLLPGLSSLNKKEVLLPEWMTDMFENWGGEMYMG